MPKIEILSDDLIARLRAGEVVQRPRDVVKELLENSLDSGATEIRIKIENGGKKLIEIMDNGCGMSQEDARICLLPHATSKIRSIEDMANISSLGFRGEALHSISTVSILELRTKEHSSDVGLLISNLGGKLSSRVIGCNGGTYVSVKALFYNTPPRKAAMKADAAETLSITRLVGRYALLYPNIEFTYFVNGTSHMVRRRTMSEESVISSIFGPEIARGMSKVDYVSDGISIKGFVCSPNISRRTSDYVVISINGRYIDDISLYAKIIRDAYRHTMQSFDFPSVILRIEIDPSKIDPNVHPQKSYVEIFDQDLLKKALFEAVLSCQPNIRLSATDGFINIVDPLSKNGPMVVKNDGSGEVSDIFDIGDAIGKIDEFPQSEAVSPPQQESIPDRVFALPELEVIGQYDRTFILAKTEGFLFAIDQHALHEKQIFEELMEKTEIESIRPPAPYILSLSAEDSDLLESAIELFKPHGLEIERLDNSTWKCYSIPSVRGQAIPESEILNIVRDTVGNLADTPSLEDFRRKVMAEIACKSAIRANEMLSLSEMQRLVEAGRKMKDSYYCPHGRPAVKVFRRGTVDRWFKRT